MTTMATEVFHVRDARLAGEIANVLNRYVGEVHDEAYMRDLIHSPKRGIVVAAVEDQTLVGCAYAEKLTAANPDELAPFDYPTDEGIMAGIYGVLVSSAVVPERRGRGIGRTLAQWRMRHMIELDCIELLAICWENGSKSQASWPLLSSVGFQEIEYRDDPWRGTPCPNCGKDCTCGGRLVSMKVG